MVSAPGAFSTSPKRKISFGSYRRLSSRDGEPRARKRLDYEEESVEDESDTLCGAGSWRPSWLQRFANLGTFTFVLSVINLLNGIFNTYFNAVITSIENRFGLSSSMMGFLKNVDNIGYLCSIMIISHFCRYANKRCLRLHAYILLLPLFSLRFLISSTVRDRMWIFINWQRTCQLPKLLKQRILYLTSVTLLAKQPHFNRPSVSKSERATLLEPLMPVHWLSS